MPCATDGCSETAFFATLEAEGDFEGSFYQVPSRLCSFCAQAHLIPAHSGLFQPKFGFFANS